MPDKRWKAVERGAAAALNKIFSDIGKTAVDRIPLLGREGPDLTINEAGLVINVKSRRQIPSYLFPPAKTMLHSGRLVIFRLDELTDIPDLATRQVDHCKILLDWYDLMDRWTQEFRPGGISAILLHRPRMPYGSMGVAIHYENVRRLSCNLNNRLS